MEHRGYPTRAYKLAMLAMKNVHLAYNQVGIQLTIPQADKIRHTTDYLTMIIVFSGHAPCDKRYPLGLRTKPLVRKNGTLEHDPAASEECTVRHRALRHPPTVQYDCTRNIVSASGALGRR